MRLQVNLETGELLELPDAEVIPLTAEQIAAQEKQKLINDLSITDQWMDRITEDTVVKLIEKGTMSKSDYDPIVITRINYRRQLRGQPPI